MRTISFFLGLGVLSCLSSCSLHPLSVQTQYLSHENLASFHVGTPDPLLDHPIIGERLLIQWSLSRNQFEGKKLILYLKIRFRNHKEQELKISIETQQGYYLYDLTNPEYCETGGILTYLAEILHQECVVASWKHPLWTTLIELECSKF